MAATMEKLRGFLPSEASVKNPVDMIVSASAESYGKAVRVLLEDPQVDSLLVIFVPPIITEAPAVAAAVARWVVRIAKPMLGWPVSLVPT